MTKTPNEPTSSSKTPNGKKKKYMTRTKWQIALETQQFHFEESTQEKWKHVHTKTCLWLLTETSFIIVKTSGNHPNIHQLVKGPTKCVLAMQWNTIWQQKWRERWHMPHDGWTSKILHAKGKKPVTKSASCLSPLTWSAQKRQLYRDRKLVSGCQGLMKMF